MKYLSLFCSYIAAILISAGFAWLIVNYVFREPYTFHDACFGALLVYTISDGVKWLWSLRKKVKKEEKR